MPAIVFPSDPQHGDEFIANGRVWIYDSSVPAWRASPASPSVQPGAHAASHHSGGSDPLTPASIGAATAGHSHSGSYAPLDHKSRHAAGGADPLTPSEIGAAAVDHNHNTLYAPLLHNHNEAYAPLVHKSRHATGGADPLTPADIGAATAGHQHVSSDVSDATGEASGGKLVRWEGVTGVTIHTAGVLGLEEFDGTQLPLVGYSPYDNTPIFATGTAGYNGSYGGSGLLLYKFETTHWFLVHIEDGVTVTEDSIVAGAVMEPYDIVMNGGSSFTRITASIPGLNLGDAATKNVGTTGGTVAAGDHTHTLAELGGVASSPSGITGAQAITNLVQITQSAYNALGSPPSNTTFIIIPD